MHPPFIGEMALDSKSIFGIITGITSEGVDVLLDWLRSNPDLMVSLILVVYPTCSTRFDDLETLADLCRVKPDRFKAHLLPVDFATERASNSLCFLASNSENVHLAIGPGEDLGQLHSIHQAHVNFAFKADPVLVEGFKRSFDYLWAKSAELTKNGVSRIPHLVLPEGTKEATMMWVEYQFDCNIPDELDVGALSAQIDPETGDVKLLDQDGSEVKPPTNELGLPTLDPLAEKMARLYEKGALVSIDKLTRIPPLAAPLDPTLFGDKPDLQNGNVTRRVTMSISVIDTEMLREINIRRRGFKTLVNKFSFGLANNMRWMPLTARRLFEEELDRRCKDGTRLITELLQGDVDAFLQGRRSQLETDLNAMYHRLGHTGQVSEDVITSVVSDLKKRLTKAQGSDLMPKLAYSSLTFSRAESEFASPWGQACSLLVDIAKFPRKAMIEQFFFLGLEVDEDEMLDAMNVVDDSVHQDFYTRGIKKRCKQELAHLKQIEDANVDSKTRCEWIYQILAGAPAEVVVQTLDVGALREE